MSATNEATGSAVVCGKWMPKAEALCGRRPGHPGKCISADTYRQACDSKPRKTGRRRGVRKKDDPEAVTRWRRAHRFNRLGITEDEFQALLDAQGGACAICREPFGDQRMCVDHDHACCPPSQRTAKTCGKCIRGLLCIPCNTNLGWFELLGESVSAYLAGHPATA